jgi:hypothetical protein
MTDNDKLSKHQTDLVSAIRRLPSRWQLLGQLSANVREPADPAIAVNAALAEEYGRIALLSDAILQLSDDERAKALVSKLGDLVSSEIKFLRGAAAFVGTAPAALNTAIGKLVWLLGSLTGAAKHQQLVAAMAETEAYFSSAA